jgi:hypothetical protein
LNPSEISSALKKWDVSLKFMSLSLSRIIPGSSVRQFLRILSRTTIYTLSSLIYSCDLLIPDGTPLRYTLIFDADLLKYRLSQ